MTQSEDHQNRNINEGCEDVGGELFSVKSRTKKRFQQLMATKWKDGEENPQNERKLSFGDDKTQASTVGYKNEAFVEDEMEPSVSEKLPPIKPSRRRKGKKNKSEDLLELTSNSYEQVASIALSADNREAETTPSSKVTVDEELVKIYNEPVADDDQILAIIVHCTDRLSLDLLVSHPMVQIHILDKSTGLYLKKKNIERAVSSYYETSRIDSIRPIMTQPFNISNRRSFVPMWEEIIVFNEPFSSFVQEEPQVLILFEVLDFVKPSSSPLHRKAKEGGWYRIAWAFLTPYGKNGMLNTGKKVRLQLFRPSNKFSANPSISQVYRWWKKKQRVPYPSTLYVTLKPYISSESIQPALRSMIPLQEERGSSVDASLGIPLSNSSDPKSSGAESVVQWGRLGDQACKVPETRLARLPSADKGCFSLKFSCNGRYLACGCCSNDGSFVSVYQIPSCQHFRNFGGHTGIIYDLDWSQSGRWLLSASADSTVRVHSLDGTGSTLVLPHPSYLYAASFHPASESLVATAGYDHVVRVWRLGVAEESRLLQELEGHTSAVNASCWWDASKLLTADASGVICIWDCSVPDGDSPVDWTLSREVRIEALKNLAICSLSLHKMGRKLLVQTTGGLLLTVDLKVEIVVHQLRGVWAAGSKRFSKSCMSPCGGLLFAGTEGGMLGVWNAHTGEEVYAYRTLGYRSIIACVQYHPSDHLLAVCAPDSNAPVLVYVHRSGKETAERPLKSATPSYKSSSELDLDSALRFHKVLKQLDSVLTYQPAVYSSISDSCTSGKTSDLRKVFKEPKSDDGEEFSAIFSRTGELEIVSSLEPERRTSPNRSLRRQRRSKKQLHQALVHVSDT